MHVIFPARSQREEEQGADSGGLDYFSQ
jgi:hypothetical protein